MSFGKYQLRSSEKNSFNQKNDFFEKEEIVTFLNSDERI